MSNPLNTWAESTDTVQHSMSLKTVQRAKTALDPRLPRAQSAAAAARTTSRLPCTLTSLPIEQRPPRISKPLSLINVDADYRKEAAEQRQVHLAVCSAKPQPEGFVRATNSTLGIEGARPKTAAHGCSSFHQSANYAEAGEGAKRNPLNPEYVLPVKSLLTDTVIKKRPATAETAPSQPRQPTHPWDQTVESQRACKLAMTKEINGEKRKDTKLLPKPTDTALKYMDYSDVARSTNRWYLEQQERLAGSKDSAALRTADVNNRKLQWNSHFTATSGKMTHRVSNPLTPRYVHDGEPYGEYEKHIRLGFRFWKSKRNTNFQHNTLDVEGAQPAEHARPKSVAAHRARNGTPQSVTLPSDRPMRETMLKRFETNDIFGAAEVDAAAIALHGRSGAYALDSKTEAQHQYRTVADRVDEELQRQWDIAHAGGPNHPGCTFHKERRGGRGTTPVAPMYSHSTAAPQAFSSSPAWSPAKQRLEESGGPSAVLRTFVSEAEKGQSDRSLKQFNDRKDSLKQSSSAQRLKYEVEMVRNLPDVS